MKNYVKYLSDGTIIGSGVCTQDSDFDIQNVEEDSAVLEGTANDETQHVVFGEIGDVSGWDSEPTITYDTEDEHPTWVYVAAGQTITYRVWAYKIFAINEVNTKIFSENYLEASVVADNSGLKFQVNMNWTVVAGADGYRVIIGSNFILHKLVDSLADAGNLIELDNPNALLRSPYPYVEDI